jgi:enamine deaminase RidA (YjgF/YER057c/UK114 family)
MTPIDPTAARQSVNLPGRNPALPFSDAILVNGTLYISGRLGIDPVTKEAPTDVDAEIKLLFDEFEAVLHEADMTMDDLVQVQIFSPALDQWKHFSAAYVERFSKELPARAFIGSGPLLLNGRFEMMGIAVKR